MLKLDEEESAEEAEGKHIFNYKFAFKLLVIKILENELKEVERQINNQTTQPTSDKTYQDLFNEKWPDASGYLTASPTKSEFNKEESKFIEGKHIFEIRPIGNNEFEYRVVNNRVSQNRASTNYDKFIQPTAQELNGPDGADTIVTVKPGILRKEGDKFIVEKEVQVFYANSSTINNKVGTGLTSNSNLLSNLYNRRVFSKEEDY